MSKKMDLVMNSIINLGKIPLVNNLFGSQFEAINAERYPLEIIEDKNLIMKLTINIDSKKMFSNYLYRSSVNIPYIQHCEKMWESLKHFNPRNIADIGGNDGALLKAFKRKSLYPLNLTNIDASESFKEDNEKNGITYHNEYWGNTAFNPKFDLITSTNVFQHNPFYEKFVKGISENLDGIWVLEFPYFLETVKTNQFDQIYHEHVYYWLVTPLYAIFSKYNLKIIDICEQNIHGGSLRMIMSNKNSHNENAEKIKKYIELEKFQDFSSWGKQITNKIFDDKCFLTNLAGTIACFGAAAKGCVYLNCLNINNRFEYIIDDTKEKQGKFSPGTGLKIFSRDILNIKKPDYILILAHNFKDFIINSLRDYGYKGKFIIMLPEIKVLD